jgi:hypothetical protein
VGIQLLPITPISTSVISTDWAAARRNELIALENDMTAKFESVINNVPSSSSLCALTDPGNNNPGAVCANQLRLLYNWRELIVSANGINDPNGAFTRYTDYMSKLPAQAETYRQNTDKDVHPGSSQNSGGVVADILKSDAVPSTNTNMLWWLSTHK